LELNKQVVSLELSKELKSAGYKQEGLFWWVRTEPNGRFYLRYKLPTEFIHLTQYVAPTVAELGERLPKIIHKDNYNYELNIFYHNRWEIQYVRTDWRISNDTDVEVFIKLCWAYDSILANAMAKMWLYLKKADIIKIRVGEGINENQMTKVSIKNERVYTTNHQFQAREKK